MNSPDRELMNLYGTEALVKQGDELPLAARIGAALLGITLMAGYMRGRNKQTEDAERMNEIARYLEAKRMEATIDALRKHSFVTGDFESQIEQQSKGPVDTGLEVVSKKKSPELAKAAGAILALRTMEKDAFGVPLMSMAGKVLGSSIGRKALIGGGIAATGYGGYKASKPVINYLTRPKRYGETPTPLQHNISEWGYPT